MVIKKLFGAGSLQQLRVLMYHKISGDGTGDFLTVPSEQLEAQFLFLQKNGYTPVLLSDLVAFTEHHQPLPPNPVLITFDDGYRNNYTVMYPLLEKYGMKANIFLVATFLQHDDIPEEEKNDEYLSVYDIRAMNPALVEYGLHSLDHKSYKELTPAEMDTDIVKSKALLKKLGIDFQPCLAFPYGAYPKRDQAKQYEFFETLRFNNISMAFRIGNRLNTLPLRNPLLVQRLDIRGDTSSQKFTRLLAKGKALFA
ncbi:MAG: polysaccharide deacetylase family protein [Chitinophagaceae bacterium]